MNGREEKVYSHESYGVVILGSASINHATRLFGSPNKTNRLITLEIHPATLCHSLGRDWISPKSGHALVEVALSEHQLGRLLSSSGNGAGVPCTITDFNGKRMASPPATPTESENIFDDFKTKMASLCDGLGGRQKQVMDILAKEGAITKADRKAIADALGKLSVEIRDNTDFALQSFREAAAKVVASAMAEIDGHAKASGLNTAAMKEGILAIPMESGIDKPKQNIEG